MRLALTTSSRSAPFSQRGATKKGLFAFVLFVFLCCALSASAQMLLPVRIATTNVLLDEYGRVLRGTSDQARSDRCLVEVLWASNSVVYPPNYDGSPHPDNPPVTNGEARIGDNISPAIVEPGRFVAFLANPRPPQNSRLFVRVYNAPTVADASFYRDSQVLTVRDNDILYAEFGAIEPIDPRDDDGDGLNNSWEKSLDSNPNNPDTDGDGMTDYEEFLAGTDIRDSGSYFATVWIEADSEGNAWLTWTSVAGKRYQVQYADEARPGDYVDVGDPVLAVGPFTQVLIQEGALAQRRFYRVKLVSD